MAPRASWKGYIKLSLVSCPVRLYPAVSANEKIRFNQLHKETHNRINMKPVDPELGLVERSDLVRGQVDLDPEGLLVEVAGHGGVRHGKAAEGLGAVEHEPVPLVRCRVQENRPRGRREVIGRGSRCAQPLVRSRCCSRSWVASSQCTNGLAMLNLR